MGFGTIHKGATGLLAFSRGLDSLSNNIANLNTPGFKRSDILFRDLFYQYQLSGDSGKDGVSSQLGNGVATKGELVSFAQGDVQETGNGSDVAINGNGFFILRKEDAVFYTRAGQFQFDEDGFLVSTSLKARVAGIDEDGNLVDIDVSGLQTNPAQPTNEITFVNNLSSSAASHEIADVEVIDSLGETHKLTFNFSNNSSVTPRSWLVSIEDEEGNVLTDDQEIRFGGDGSPEEGFNSFTFTFQPEGGANSTDITMFFGEPGSFSGATSFSGGSTSSLAVDDQNGLKAGTLLDFRFTDDGTLELRYTNEETVDAARLALGWFDQLQALQQVGDSLFLAPEGVDVTVDAPGQGVMGEIIGSSVEISNVELTQEFTDLIIMQRGYQASSQVVTVANEMIQQLLDAGKGR